MCRRWSHFLKDITVSSWGFCEPALPVELIKFYLCYKDEISGFEYIEGTPHYGGTICEEIRAL